ncbi:amino acid ABC transporter permease [Sanguibacter massiliensis]|uniref:amino acid ABC transporter permease n=1 Tax=Sanguibacter massiliensis TaxID=1973217 RepID=UPI000C81FCB5|nr:amino acid ABC transporter permease [Sanguibacter massiliensis]
MPVSGLEVLLEGRNLARLLEGLGTTVGIALASLAVALVCGVPLGLAMTRRGALVQVLTRGYVETMRIVPQLVLLFVVYFDLARQGLVSLSGAATSILVLGAWGAAEMGDLVRGAVTSIPAHQVDSARALGLAPAQVQRLVVLPQTLRRLAPLTVNLTTRLVKTTSLVVLIGVVEVLKVAQQIIDANRFEHPEAAFWVYGLVLGLYFVVCYPVSVLARRLETRWESR